MKHSLKTFLFLATALFGGAPGAHGHAIDQSNLFLSIGDTTLSGRVEIAVNDLNTALGLNLPTGDAATLDAIRPYEAQIRDYLGERVRVTIAGESRALLLGEFALLPVDFASFLQVEFEYPPLAEPYDAIDVEYSVLFDVQPDHRGMLVVETNWKTGTFDNEANVSLVFEPGRERQTLDLSSSSTLTGFNAMVRMGMHHIWIGIDHILFLMALLAPAVVQRTNGRWGPVDSFRTALIRVIKIVTIFTIAHTITLSLAALGTVSLSSRLVESIIALSIAIAALNIVMPIFREKIWIVVFVFGLFHGFGFASVLGEIGIPSNYMVLSLLGFNVGVEVGQVAIVLVAFPVLYITGRSMAYSRYLLPAATTCLITVSLYWFTERAFLIDLPAGAILNSIIAWVS